MTIRPPGEGDCAEWAAMRSQLWPEFDAAEMLAEAKAFIAGTKLQTVDFALIALTDENQTPVAFIEVSIRPFADGCASQPVPHVEGWYVKPSARGRGIGKALMASAERWARERGFTELASDTEVKNAASLAAHERCGFVETERLVKLRKPL